MRKTNSIIQSTTITVSLIIVSLLIISFIFIACTYWGREELREQNNLLAQASALEKTILLNYDQINDYKTDPELSSLEKIRRVKALLAQEYYKLEDFKGGFQKKEKEIEIGYFDSELKTAIPVITEESKLFSNQDIPFNLLQGLERSETFKVIKGLGNSQEIGGGLTTIIVPIYSNCKKIGFSWATNQSRDIWYYTWLEFRKVLLFGVALWAVVLFFIRRSFLKIKSALDGFSKMIVDGENGDRNIWQQLPELLPILERRKSDFDSLRKLNAELESSNEKLLTIIQGISDGFFSVDRDWNLLVINKEMKRQLSAETENLTGKNIWEFCESRFEPLTRANLIKAMTENIQLSWEAKNAEGDRYFEFHAYPFARGLTVFVKEKTEEIKNYRELQRLEKLNLIGQLAAGISHEIRNPLTTVRGFLQMMEICPDSPSNEYIKIMISEIDRTNSIISDFLSLSKTNSDTQEVESLNDLILRIYPMLQGDAFSSDKDIVLELNEIPNLSLNESEFRQLILNLVHNALEETPPGGVVTIRTYLLGSEVFLAITDQGKGIPEEIREKIGTPFVTTKESGTGLGLAISYGIAKRHRARIEFETSAQGTTFYVIFPTTPPK
ncbi:MAG: two-component system sensor histidine kinase NtrB [Desulfitobacteriia bacterium]|jgi:two-component system, sporulation sensor kinase E